MTGYPSFGSLLEDRRKSCGPGRRLRVCVVTSEFLGPVKNGGIGAATSGLLDVLSRDGHEVTLLYTLVQHGVPECAERTWDHWVDDMATRGVRVRSILHRGDYRGWREKAWHVSRFVGAEPFDLVVFNEHHGSGYYAQAAKRAGLEPFASQTHCVVTHGAMQWVVDVNDQPLERVGDLEMLGLERRSVEWADIVVSPSRYILDTYASYGWALPERTFHQPLPLLREPLARDREAVVPVRELVFFGRLETRKGLWLFCDALDALGDEIADVAVTFLGRATVDCGLSTVALLMGRASRWPCRLRLLDGFGQSRALEYLRGSGRLAVMPSLADNSPCVIYECMENAVPFVGTRGTGMQELVDPRDHDAVLVAPEPEALAGILRRCLATGARHARPSFDPVRNLEEWSGFIRAVASPKAAVQPLLDNPIGPGRSLLPTTEGRQTAGKIATGRGHRCAKREAAIVRIDTGGPFRDLMRLLALDVANAGPSTPICLITARGGAFRGILAQVTASAFEQVTVLDAHDGEAVRAALAPNDIVVFADTNVELSEALLDRMPALSELIAFATLLVGERAGDGGVRIGELPCGDLPGVHLLGVGPGSDIWLARTDALLACAASTMLVDIRDDVPLNAREIADAVMVEAIGQGASVDVLPLVGGVRTGKGRSRTSHRARTRAAERARSVGVAPDIHRGGAAWFAISAFGPDQDDAAAPDVVVSRPDLALQRAAAGVDDLASARSAIDAAVEHRKTLAGIDLAADLRAGLASQVAQRAGTGPQGDGRASRVKRLMAASLAPVRDAAPVLGAPATAGMILADGGETLTADAPLSASRSVGIGRSKLVANGMAVLPDITVGGHSQVRLQIGGASPFEVELRVLDQDTGHGLDQVCATIVSRDGAVLSLPLHGVATTVMIVVSTRGVRAPLDLLELSVLV